MLLFGNEADYPVNSTDIFIIGNSLKKRLCDDQIKDICAGIHSTGHLCGMTLVPPHECSWASLVAHPVKNPPIVKCGRPGFSPWVGKIPWRSERLHTPVFWPGEFHGLYSPESGKESDTTEHLSLHITFLSHALGWTISRLVYMAPQRVQLQ